MKQKVTAHAIVAAALAYFAAPAFAIDAFPAFWSEGTGRMEKSTDTAKTSVHVLKRFR